MKKFLGLSLIFLIPLIPVILWTMSSPLSSFITSIGQILGLIGFSLFTLTLIFNTRIKLLEDVFGGLNKVFPIHHLLGKITFIFLLFHPLVLTAQNLSFSVKEAILFLLPGKSLAVNFGIFSLQLLIILLIFTLFIKLPYHIFKFIHQFLGVAYIFAILHIVTIGSDISFNTYLKIYMLMLAAGGITAYSYRTVFKKILVKKYEYIVEKINKLNTNIFEIILSPKNNKIDFKPGQFVFIEFNNPGLPKEQHPFSLTSNPSENKLGLAVKALGDYTAKLCLLNKNAPAYIEGPYGKFAETKFKKKDQIWIAGGIGITPFLSMAKSLDNKNNTIDLFYSVKTKNEAVFIEQLNKISSKNSNLKIHLWITNEKGRLSAEKILKNIKNPNDEEIFICGPIPMITSLKNQFMDLGIEKKQLHFEEFQLV